MIIRRQRNGEHGNSFSFYCEYGLADIAAAMKDFYCRFLYCMNTKDAVLAVLHTEQDVRFFLENSIFSIYHEKHRQQMSAWGFRIAVENQLLTASTVNSNSYYLTEKCVVKIERPARKEEKA